MTARITPLILFVRRFDRCLAFYQNGLGLRIVRLYRGDDHPSWAEFQVGDLRLCLHGNYRGPRFRTGRPLAIHFEVKDIRKAIRRIRLHGGRVAGRPRRYDFRPAELMTAYAASFADPDGNVFEVQQVLQRFRGSRPAGGGP